MSARYLIAVLAVSQVTLYAQSGLIPKAGNTREPQCTSPRSLNEGRAAHENGLRYACFDDGQTQEGSTHRCPNYFVMTGAARGNNWFHCTYVGAISGQYIATGVTREEQIRLNGYDSIRCRPGTVMLGLNVGENRLICGKIDSASPPELPTLVNTSSTVRACPAVGDPDHLSVMIGWNEMRSTMVCESVTLPVTTN